MSGPSGVPRGGQAEPICVRLDAVSHARNDTGRRSFVFEELIDVVQTDAVDAVAGALARIETAVDAEGLHAAGFICYEAAAGLDEAMVRGVSLSGLPLVWFGLFRQRRQVEALEGVTPSARRVTAWLPEWTSYEHGRRLRRIRALIGAGDTYQVNLTMRLRAAYDGDAQALYRALCAAQPTSLCAFVDTGRFAICSASPELHFALDHGVVHTRPMKGTRPRGRWVEEDDALAAELAASAKDRAENTMIVDLLRNDLGRAAVPGSVQVERLWEVERYDTVWQMTSTIHSRLRRRTSLVELFAALFPCGSVTGAPKVRSMQIIDEVEDSPRGVYTGSIGYLSPGRGGGLTGMEGRFSVAIRTVCLDRACQLAVAGVGGGITWGSEPAAEYEECLTKARFLSRSPARSFCLLETMRADPEEGIWLLERHLQRLAASARYFGFTCDESRVRRELGRHLPAAGGPWRLRLTLAAGGQVVVRRTELDTEVDPVWSAALAEEPVDSSDILLYHKTTQRSLFERALAGLPACVDEAILVNERSELTQTTRGNLVVVTGSRRLTPPREAGLLPGTYRAELLERGEIEEACLSRQDLAAADEVYSINSVRRWVRLELPRQGLEATGARAG